MKLQIATACAVFSLSLAGSAFADGRVTATLETPQAAQAKFIASHALWNCEASTCVGDLEPGATADLFGCRALAKKVGRLASFGDAKPLDDKTLAKCNTAAVGPAPVGTASR